MTISRSSLPNRTSLETFASKFEELLNQLNNQLVSFSPFEAWTLPWEEYMECLKGNSKALFTLVFNTIKKNHQTMCSGGDKTDLAYGHLRCLNKKTIPEIKETSTKMKALFELIAT